MSIEADDEILQDFLVEAGEILERLNDELLELERNPQDTEILNAVFRGFHTIKGGASFLSLDGLVEVCHITEDIFNVLRNGERSVDTELMDTVLQVLDVVNAMFEEVQQGAAPTPAEPELLNKLRAMLVADATAPVETAPEPESSEDITDTEFDAIVAQAQSSPASQPADTAATATVSGGDDISEDEFDAMLDKLHGAGKGPTVPATPTTPAPGGDISEDEFDAVLDQLHGAGKGPKVDSVPVVVEKADTQTQTQTIAADPEVKASKEEAKGVSTEVASSAAKPKEKAAPAPIQAEATVRVDTRRLDDIMNMVGELVLARNRLSTLKESMGNEDMTKAVANLDMVTANLQSAVMKTRMQPIKKVFGRFPRVVRDLARALNKEVKLELKGEDTDLDKNLVEALADPLVHLVRNSVDHGVEMPDDREAAGKPRCGSVILSAEQEGDHILLSIEDDGKGMDADVLRGIAVEKGLMDEESAARLDNKDCYNLIFAAGFSTKKEISDISGRGVGMDVVKTRIGQLNGSVEIDSELGRGSRLMIRVPLTLAIMPTLMVKLGGQPFALPLGSVSEIFDLDEGHTNEIDGQLVVKIRDRAMPLFFLREWLVTDGSQQADSMVGHVVVVHVGSQKVGFVVEQLVGQEEVVIKPLGAFLHGLDGFAGATITGDGRIALILDVPSLMKSYAR